VLTR